MKYEEAMKRLEQIVSDIENNKLDIDLISDKIKEALMKSPRADSERFWLK